MYTDMCTWVTSSKYVPSLPVQILLDKKTLFASSKLKKNITLFIHPHRNHSIQKMYFVVVVFNIKMKVGQPNHTFQPHLELRRGASMRG